MALELAVRSCGLPQRLPREPSEHFSLPTTSGSKAACSEQGVLGILSPMPPGQVAVTDRERADLLSLWRFSGFGNASSG